MSSGGMTSGMKSRRRSARTESTIVDRVRLGRVMTLGPTALWYAIFFLVPLALMVRYSFAFTDQSRLEFVWTWDNYVRVATDPIYRTLLWKSVRLAAVVTVAALAIGYP